MKCISLVCTVHEENGLANVSGLYAILERIRPEVIFIEAPPDALDQFLAACTNNKLESASVRLYRENNIVELVPVDLPTPNSRFFSDYRYLQERIEGKNPDSRRLIMWNKNYIRDYGFSYLNSEHCNKMWAEIHADERAIIGEIKDQKLTEIYEIWNKTIELRDNEMMKNILKYCGENTFERGAFLIGAAHRQSIIEKSKEWSEKYPNIIQWDFTCGIPEFRGHNT